METLIRLSTAHAKARLSPKVQEQDARAAEEVLQFALFKEVLKRQKRKKRRLNNGAATAEDEDGEHESDVDEGEEVDEKEAETQPQEKAVAQKPNGLDTVLAAVPMDVDSDASVTPDR